MSLRAKKNAIIRENQLDFLEEQYSRGIQLPIEKIHLLVKHKRIKLSEKRQEELNSKDKDIEEVFEAHEKEVIEAEEADLVKTFDSFSLSDRFNIDTPGDIHSGMWKPKSKINHDEEFILWIDSINTGFQNMTKYDPFRRYCEQAKRWIDEGSTISDFESEGQKIEWVMNEFRRCSENILYALDKYLMIKEADLSSGSMKYTSKPGHKVICFLVDAGYSFMMGKGRQMAATTTLAGIAMMKMIFKKNFFIKMIAQDEKKVQEIFDDKIKYPFGELPAWMKPEVSNFTDNFFRLGKKGSKKGTTKGVGSKIQVVAPSVAAINGGAPPLVMVDEAGYISILGKMIKEARPTMFMQDPVTKKLEMKRQIVVWGTGGEMDKGGKAYETEFMSLVKKWKDREFGSGMVPLFLDWTARPGISRQHYLNEQKSYTVEGPEKEARSVQFRQHYPSTIEDMFLTSNKLLVGIDWINTNLERIRSMDAKHKPVKGYFEPIFNTANPAEEQSDVEFEVIGANFIPLDDRIDDMNRASATMFLQPNKKWVNRYYQGTDPIMSDNGYSNMASVIFDNYFKTAACVMDYRDNDHKYTFLQTMLMGVYYNTSSRDNAVPELVESNIGTAYVDYKEAKGFGKTLVYRTQLPDHMQGGGTLIGIDNRGNRNKFIINKMFEVLKAYGENMCIDTIFNQLKFFNCTITSSGSETWGTADPRKYHDDVLFGLVFSYICSLCFEHIEPREINSESDRYKTVYKLKRVGGSLTRVPIRVPIRD